MTQHAASTSAARAEDLTAKARIRHAALDLFAAQGIDSTPLRKIAAQAGVTVGLIVHHYGTKRRLQDAVEESILERFGEAISSVPFGDLSAPKLVAARDQAVLDMLAAQPAIAHYLRRAVLESGGPDDVMSRLAELSARQVRELRAAGLASTRPPVGEQVLIMMVRQLGRLVLQPLVDRIAAQFADDLADSAPPQLVVTLKQPNRT